MVSERIKSATALVMDPASGQRLGTAWLVAPGYALTALHVVQLSSGSLRPLVQLRFAGGSVGIAAEARCAGFNTELDLAVLQFPLVGNLKKLPVIPCVPLPRAAQPGIPWSSFGYPDLGIEGSAAHGLVSDARASLASAGGPNLLQLTVVQGPAHSLRGLSGAPVIVNDVAVGFVREYPVVLERAGAGQSSREVAHQVIFATSMGPVLKWLARPAADRPALFPVGGQPPRAWFLGARSLRTELANGIGKQVQRFAELSDPKSPGEVLLERSAQLARLETITAQGGQVTLLVAPAGFGKSFLAAQLLHRLRGVGVFISETNEVRDAETIGRHLVGLVTVMCDLDYPPSELGSYSEGTLERWRHYVLPDPDGERPRLLVIDGLDEAINPRDVVTRLGLGRDIPTHVHLVCIGRPGSWTGEFDDISLATTVRLDATDQQGDLLAYIRAYRAGQGSARVERVDQAAESSSETAIVQKAEGSFQYVNFVLDDLRKGAPGCSLPQWISNLPVGLTGYYKRHLWPKIRDDATGAFKQVFLLLLTAFGRVRTDWLANVSQRTDLAVSGEEVEGRFKSQFERYLSWSGSATREDPGVATVAFGQATVRQFLLGQYQAEEIRAGHEAVVRHYRALITSEESLAHDLYGPLHYPLHVLEAEGPEAAVSALNDVGYALACFSADPAGELYRQAIDGLARALRENGEKEDNARALLCLGLQRIRSTDKGTEIRSELKEWLLERGCISEDAVFSAAKPGPGWSWGPHVACRRLSAGKKEELARHICDWIQNNPKRPTNPDYSMLLAILARDSPPSLAVFLAGQAVWWQVREEGYSNSWTITVLAALFTAGHHQLVRESVDRSSLEPERKEELLAEIVDEVGPQLPPAFLRWALDCVGRDSDGNGRRRLTNLFCNFPREFAPEGRLRLRELLDHPERGEREELKRLASNFSLHEVSQDLLLSLGLGVFENLIDLVSEETAVRYLRQCAEEGQAISSLIRLRSQGWSLEAKRALVAVLISRGPEDYVVAACLAPELVDLKRSGVDAYVAAGGHWKNSDLCEAVLLGGSYPLWRYVVHGIVREEEEVNGYLPGSFLSREIEQLSKPALTRFVEFEAEAGYDFLWESHEMSLYECCEKLSVWAPRLLDHISRLHAKNEISRKGQLILCIRGGRADFIESICAGDWGGAEKISYIDYGLILLELARLPEAVLRADAGRYIRAISRSLLSPNDLAFLLTQLPAKHFLRPTVQQRLSATWKPFLRQELMRSFAGTLIPDIEWAGLVLKLISEGLVGLDAATEEKLLSCFEGPNIPERDWHSFFRTLREQPAQRRLLVGICCSSYYFCGNTKWIDPFVRDLGQTEFRQVVLEVLDREQFQALKPDYRLNTLVAFALNLAGDFLRTVLDRILGLMEDYWPADGPESNFFRGYIVDLAPLMDSSELTRCWGLMTAGDRARLFLRDDQLVARAALARELLRQGDDAAARRLLPQVREEIMGDECGHFVGLGIDDELVAGVVGSLARTEPHTWTGRAVVFFLRRTSDAAAVATIREVLADEEMREHLRTHWLEEIRSLDRPELNELLVALEPPALVEEPSSAEVGAKPSSLKELLAYCSAESIDTEFLVKESCILFRLWYGQYGNLSPLADVWRCAGIPWEEGVYPLAPLANS